MKIQQGIVAGLLFGVAMGLLSGITIGMQNGLEQGLIMAGCSLIIGGPLFGVIMYKFANSRLLKDQTQIKADYLLPDETIISSRNANLVIKLKDFNLRKMAFGGDFMWAVGMKGKEALGGRIHLTNYRLIFKSHEINRVKGITSIFLPTISDLQNTSFFIAKKMTVETINTKVQFIVYDVDDFIAEITKQIEQLDMESIKALQKYSLEYPNKCTDGLKSWTSVNVLNNLGLLGDAGKEALEVIANPIGGLGALFLKELVEHTVGVQWQKKFSK